MINCTRSGGGQNAAKFSIFVLTSREIYFTADSGSPRLGTETFCLI